MALLKFKFPGPSTADVQVNIPSRSLVVPVEKSIWAIGGGKGGIGKTILTANMAVYLSWLNKKVVVVDLDLGGANLHTSLGVEAPVRTLSDFVVGKVENVNDLIQTTPFRNLFLISGAHDPVGIANLRHVQKIRLLRKFREVAADFILLDLGAGTSSNTVDFFLLAEKKIVIVTPEPTAIENAYRFIKSAFYRMLRSSTSSTLVRQLVEKTMDQKDNRAIRTPNDLITEVSRLAPVESLELRNKMEHFAVSLIVNQIRVKAEADIGRSIQMVCSRYFGMKVDYAGYLPYDNAVWQSIRRRIPFMVDSPNSTAVTHLEDILRHLLQQKEND
ncbi:MAG: P-loop NTPase [Deltaproteobacteria bacterium]|nr:P-loop NTPase [Deltaproteobacteria bacterium]